MIKIVNLLKKTLFVLCLLSLANISVASETKVNSEFAENGSDDWGGGSGV